MFITQAYADAPAVSHGGGFDVMSFLPLALIFVVFYFLILRPQQKKAKQHQQMLSAIRRGDKVIIGGGIIGTISKLTNDQEVQVEIAEEVRIRVMRSTITEVLSKTDPVANSDTDTAKSKKAKKTENE